MCRLDVSKELSGNQRPWYGRKLLEANWKGWDGVLGDEDVDSGSVQPDWDMMDEAEKLGGNGWWPRARDD